jgi:hypothetical protein
MRKRGRVHKINFSMYPLPIEPNAKCPVCGSPAFEEGDYTLLVVCPVCGKFRLLRTAKITLGDLRNRPGFLSHKISFALRTISQRAMGNDDETFYPIYTFQDFEEMLRRPELPIQQRLNLLLQYLAAKSEHIGQVKSINFACDYSVIGAKNDEESIFCVYTLESRGFVSNVFYGDATRHDRSLKFQLTANGWAERERIEQSGSLSANAFIAMSFNEDRQKYNVAIQQTIQECGYLPIRIDEKESLDSIDDVMIAAIRESKFMVADFTGHRQNVYFEAGYMLGLARPVVWLCEKTHIDDRHFDVHQFPMIDYADESDLRRRLKNRILANFGAGPHRK